MDTRGYVYPPMDDLLNRQNAAGAGGFDPNGSDGGDLYGGDGLNPNPGESDVGSGLELDRSLQRVAAQEALLNEQRQQPVESWLQSHGGKQISLENFGGSSPSADFTLLLIFAPINGKSSVGICLTTQIYWCWTMDVVALTN